MFSMCGHVLGRAESASDFGLGYDVVMALSNLFEGQGYHIYFDNYFTSPALIDALAAKGILACGTVNKNRRGFPDVLKDPWPNAKRGT